MKLKIVTHKWLNLLIPAASPTEMTTPVKLLDTESLTLVDNCLEYLSDRSDFLVVGVVGYQGVGKSTIMSLLAEPKSISNK